MIDFVSAHAGATTVVLAVLITAGVLATSWESLSLWLLSTWHSLPFVGGIAWLARRESSRHSTPHAESSAVSALCSSYARYIRVLSRAEYDNCMNYLRKAGDLGRQPFPPYLRAIIFSMVLVEAAGLAYVLAGWTLPGASEFAQRIAAGGIGFLIAVILVFFTHWAGLEIDRCNRYRRDRSEWIAAGRRGPLFGPDLSLNDAQSVDDHEPAFRQRATRGHGQTGYVMTVITLIMVFAVGSGAAYVRGQVIEQEILLESSTRTAALQRFSLSAPDTANADPVGIDQQAIHEEMLIKRRGGWGTLIILGIIFFFLQVLGIFFGYRHSFNGRLSKDAYRALKADRFSSYGELLQYYDRIADIAQNKLERLQQLLDHKQRDRISSPTHQPYTFRDYLQAREAQRRDKPLGVERAAPPAVPAASSQVAAVPSSMPAAQSPVQADPSSMQAAPSPVQAAPSSPPAAPSPVAPSPAVVQSPPQAEAAAPSISPKPARTNGSAQVVPPAAAEEPVVLHNAEALLGPGLSARAQLELAEKTERQRAAERTARGRNGAKRKTPARSESEVG